MSNNQAEVIVDVQQLFRYDSIEFGKIIPRLQVIAAECVKGISEVWK